MPLSRRSQRSSTDAGSTRLQHLDPSNATTRVTPERNKNKKHPQEASSQAPRLALLGCRDLLSSPETQTTLRWSEVFGCNTYGQGVVHPAVNVAPGHNHRLPPSSTITFPLQS